MEKKTTIVTDDMDRKLAEKIKKRLFRDMGPISFSQVVRLALRSLARELGLSNIGKGQ